VDSSSSLFSQTSSLGQSVWTESGLPGLDFGASNAHPGIPQSLLLLWNNAGSRSNTPGLAGAPKPPPPGFGAPLLNHAAGGGAEAAGGAAPAAGGLGGAPLAQAALPVLLQPIGSGAAAAGGARPAPPGYGQQQQPLQQQQQQQLGGLGDMPGGVGAAGAGAQGMEGGSLLNLQQQHTSTGFYQQW
jgi:hypothetical protein